MFFSTLKKRTTQLLKGEDAAKTEEEEEEEEALEDLSGINTLEVARIMQEDGDAVVAHYRVQNGTSGERGSAAFLLPAVGGMVTGATVRAHFPLPGHFHFRYRVVGPSGDPASYLWLDPANDQEPLPLYKGGISMKALRLPDGASARAHEQLTGSAPTLVGRANGSPPGGSPRDSMSPSHGSGAMQPASPRPAGPTSDLMELDLGSSPATRLGALAAAVPAPPPVKMPNRQTLVEQRLATERKRVEETVKAHIERKTAEEEAKTAKIEAANRLAPELDGWARTGDGQSWKDIRTLLSTMHTVSWQGSGWDPLPLSELVAREGNVKKYYRKAIILFHPDRHQEAAAEKQVRADRIFQALNEAFKVSEG